MHRIAITIELPLLSNYHTLIASAVSVTNVKYRVQEHFYVVKHCENIEQRSIRVWKERRKPKGNMSKGIKILKRRSKQHD